MGPILFGAFVVVLVGGSFVQSADLPKEFPTCQKGKEDFLDCLGKAILVAAKLLKNGNEALKIETTDPSYVEEAIIGRGSGAVDVQQNYSKIYLHGLTNVDSVKVQKADMENFHLEFESHHPLVRWQANYKASGKILLLPIYGEGLCNITISDAVGTHSIKGEFSTKKGKTYVKCKEYSLKIKPNRVHYNYSNLFNGNKLLGNNMNDVMNDNWDVLYEDVRDGYEAVVALVLKKYADAVFARIPFNNIFT